MEPEPVTPPSEIIIKRTNVGLALLYIPAVVAVVIIIILRQVLSSYLATNFSSSTREIIDILAAAAGALGLVMLFVATYIYRQNRLVIGDHECTQITRLSFFDRKTSHLQLTDVEDVNVAQRGVLPNLFNYGTLTIETAGAVDNFVFIFCPNPNRYAQMIQQARGRYVNKNQLDKA